VIGLDTTPFVPDIELDIAKPDGNATRGYYKCVMRNAHGVPVPDEATTIDLGEDAGTFAKSLIDQVRQYSGGALVAIMLEGSAGQIAGKLPNEFWDVLRNVAPKVANRPITLQLNSAEPFVPWELAWVEPAIDSARPSFLGAQVVMGRWILGDNDIVSPPRHARSIRAMAVMAGMYKSTTGLVALPQAIEEARTLTRSFEAMPAVPLDGTAANLQALLDAEITFNFNAIGGVECVHFAGHGEVDPSRPGDAAIYLNDGHPITPLFFRNSALGKTYAPFLFLNACMVGTAGKMLGDYGGFPGNCLAGGFCGLVAPLWAVNDSVAKAFAIEFYDEALAERTNGSVAEILRELRAKYDRRRPVPSYLAYVYYGHPYLSLSRAAPVAAAAGASAPAAGGAS
jgi:CHAT domain